MSQDYDVQQSLFEGSWVNLGWIVINGYVIDWD